jgi:hypothetical protein
MHSPCFSSFNTERTVYLSGLCVEVFLTTESTEVMPKRRESSRPCEDEDEGG